MRCLYVKIVNKLFQAYPDIQDRLSYFINSFYPHATSGAYALYTAVCMVIKRFMLLIFMKTLKIMFFE
ncbi:hypothetical protein SAMN02745150_01421 [Brevinema andersonii]|uniref:Uncharacterized protein n=1 Tax=Brevinema andersonii TaxID=34097 RepID=A0A1I1FDG4_BREAD|nr:hypothetical protein SAMN02745150_01421 [Brevinema andersonii]